MMNRYVLKEGSQPLFFELLLWIRYNRIFFCHYLSIQDIFLHIFISPKYVSFLRHKTYRNKSSRFFSSAKSRNREEMVHLHFRTILKEGCSKNINKGSS